MKNFNKVIIMGNLVRDPEIKYLPSGMPVANFSIAVNDSYKKDGQAVEKVSYLDIIVFSKQGENCNEYLSKGKPVLVEGRLQQRRWEAQDGTKRSKVEIVASNVVFLGSAEKSGAGNKPAAGARDNDFEPVNDDDIPF